MLLIEKVKELLKKKTVNNGLWLYLLQFFNTVIPLVTVSYLTRMLGVEKYGAFNKLNNFITYLQVFVEYGFALSATRKVTMINDENSLNKLFSSVILSRLFLYMVSLMITTGYIIIYRQNTEKILCVCILAIGLIAYCFQENWLFQGKQDMKLISISSIIARLVTTILIFIFVKNPNDLFVYCILYIMSPIISNSIATTIAITKYKVRFIKLKIKDIISCLKDGVYIFFTNLSSKVFGAIGVTFLGLYYSDYYVGIYSAIYKIPYVLTLLWGPISQVLYPISSSKISTSYTEGKKFIMNIRKYILLLFCIISIFIGLLAKQVVLIAFGKEYVDYYYIVYPLLIWVLLGINNNFLGIQILVGSGHDQYYSSAFQIGVIVTILVNYIFIYYKGIHGASFAPMISEFILCILLLVQIKKIERI